MKWKRHGLAFASFFGVELLGAVWLIVCDQGVLNLGDLLIYSFGGVLFSLGLAVSDAVLASTPDDAV